MKRIFIILSVSLLIVACGKKTQPTIGGGNNENNEEHDVGADGDDMSDPVVDMSATEDLGSDAEIDTGPADMAPVDMESVDMESVDMTPDVSADTDTDTSTADMTPDVAPDMDNCPDETRDDGTACDCDDQCAGGVCLDADPQAGVEGFCSRTCSDRSECDDGAGCLAEPDGTTACRPDDTGTACTANDTFDPAACSRACLQAGSNHLPAHFCSIPCESASDCQMAHACAPTRCRQTVDGLECIPTIVAHRAGADKDQVLMNFPVDSTACIPMGAANPCDFPSDQFACASALCDDDQMRCSAQCLETADCPVGACTDLDVSDPDLPIRFCDLIQ